MAVKQGCEQWCEEGWEGSGGAARGGGGAPEAEWYARPAGIGRFMVRFQAPAGVAGYQKWSQTQLIFYHFL